MKLIDPLSLKAFEGRKFQALSKIEVAQMPLNFFDQSFN